MNEKRNRENGDFSTPTFSFGLLHLFYAVSLFATGLALDPATIFFTFLALLFWGFCLIAYRTSKNWLSLILVFLAFVIFLLALIPAVQQVRESSRHVACLNNMRQLMLANLNYESSYGEFPSTKLTVNGNRHSWRTAILPFVEANQVFNKYDFNAPWDSKANLSLAQTLLEGFSCPSRDHDPKTPYKLVVGPGTLFVDGQAATLDRLTDGTSNTIGLVEDHSNPVLWTDPTDLTVDEAVELLFNQCPENSVHSYSSRFRTTFHGTHVGMLDGSVRTVGFGAIRKELRNAFLCADGEFIENTQLGHPITVLKYDAIIAAAAYVILLLLPGLMFLINRRLKHS